MSVFYRFVFSLVLFFSTAQILFAQEPISISDAREQSTGTEVTVSGWITVTDHFRGPIYLQDETAGIAAFSSALMRDDGFQIDAEVGDSVVVTGELSEFNDLLQLTDGSSELQVEVYPEGNRDVEPEEIYLDQMNTGDYESQLIQISQADVDAFGFLQTFHSRNGSYSISDRTGGGVFHIEALASHLEGSPVPSNNTDITGIAGNFQGTVQLLPRKMEDMGVEPFEYAGDDLASNQALDVITWNIEWFGDQSNGPDDIDQQVENVVTMVKDFQADLIAVQEIADNQLFREAINEIEGYAGFTTDTDFGFDFGYIYNTESVDSIRARELTGSQGMNSFDHASRYPFEFTFGFELEGEQREITAINVHAKAFAGQEDYERRQNAAEQIHDYIRDELFRSRQNKVIYLGDYNDRILESNYQGAESPYQPFVDDPDFEIVSKALEEDDFFSFGFSPNREMIDHITISSELSEFFIEGSQRVAAPAVVDQYLTTTSDHYPVLARFDAGVATSADNQFAQEEELPTEATLNQNYPNPFNPVTQIGYSIPESAQVQLEVYDVLGRKVEVLVDEHQQAGEHEVRFDGSDLSSGTYLYRLRAGDIELTRQMMLVK